MSRWLYMVPAIVMMVVIFIFSAQTGDELNSFLPFFHRWFPQMESFNWGHFVAYFVLGLTYWLALHRVVNAPWRRKLLAILLCLLYGLTDEYHQSFVGGRSPDVMDIRNDTIGAALAMLVLSIPPFSRWIRNH